MSDLPQHIGFIIDGNRRWAKNQGLYPFEGHLQGYEKLHEVGEWCLDRGVKYLTIYAFSTENWKRSKEEVEFLMSLMYKAVHDELHRFHDKNIRLRVIGRREGLSEKLQAAIKEAEIKTINNTRGTLTLAWNYGGRAEIVDACNKLSRLKQGEEIREEDVRNALYAPDVPDPDLIIRTSGEQRLSGFLTWESTYSELYFAPMLWPDFSQPDLDAALAWYAGRERRLGK